MAELEHADAVFHLAAAPSGILASIAGDQCLYIWDADSGERINKIALSAAVYDAKWGYDSCSLYLATQMGIEVWGFPGGES